MPLKHELDCIKIKELCNDRIKLFWFRKVPKIKCWACIHKQEFSLLLECSSQEVLQDFSAEAS
jgi:hypothetical protein